MTSSMQVIVQALKSSMMRGFPIPDMFIFRRFSSHLWCGMTWMSRSGSSAIRASITDAMSETKNGSNCCSEKGRQAYMTTSKAFPWGLRHQCSLHAHFRFSWKQTPWLGISRSHYSGTAFDYAHTCICLTRPLSMNCWRIAGVLSQMTGWLTRVSVNSAVILDTRFLPEGHEPGDPNRVLK